MEFKIADRASIGRERWDAFVGESDEAWLWHRYDLQDALACWRNYTEISLGILEADSKGNLLGIIPLHLITGHSIQSVGGPAFSNNIARREKSKLFKFVRDHLLVEAAKYNVSEINLLLAAMTPAYSGGRCPRVNPLIELGCENTLTQTWIIDLKPGKETVWKGMEGRARTAVRKAMKNDVRVREAGYDDLDIYYALHCETYERTGVPPHPKNYFEEIWNKFLLNRLAVIYLAEYKSEVIAAENFGIFKKRAIYWTGAASRKGLELEANSLIQWTAIQWLLVNGFEYYEVGEAFPAAETGKAKGLNDFKKSFGGELYPFYKGRFVVPHSVVASLQGNARLRDRLLDLSLRKIARRVRKVIS
jgi:hypothetical protein